MTCRGADFELELSHSNDYYREHGLAEVWKMHTGVAHSHNGRGSVVNTGMN